MEREEQVTPCCQNLTRQDDTEEGDIKCHSLLEVHLCHLILRKKEENELA